VRGEHTGCAGFFCFRILAFWVLSAVRSLRSFLWSAWWGRLFA